MLFYLQNRCCRSLQMVLSFRPLLTLQRIHTDLNFQLLTTVCQHLKLTSGVQLFSTNTFRTMLNVCLNSSTCAVYIWLTNFSLSFRVYLGYMSFLSRCQASFRIFVKRVRWNSKITIMLLTSFCILIMCLLDDVRLLLGEIGSWSLSSLGKIKLRYLRGFCLCH